MANDPLSQLIDSLFSAPQQGTYDYGSNALLAEPQQGVMDPAGMTPAEITGAPQYTQLSNGLWVGPNGIPFVPGYPNYAQPNQSNADTLGALPIGQRDMSYYGNNDDTGAWNYGGNDDTGTWNTVQGSSYQPIQLGPWGNDMSQYNGQSYDGTGGPAIIANLPQASQDYYSARGVQNFDPGNQYGSSPPVAMAPSGNASFGGGIVPSGGVNIPTVQGGQPIASSDIGGTGGYMWGNQNNYGNGYAWGNNDGGEVG